MIVTLAVLHELPHFQVLTQRSCSLTHESLLCDHPSWTGDFPLRHSSGVCLPCYLTNSQDPLPSAGIITEGGKDVITHSRYDTQPCTPISMKQCSGCRREGQEMHSLMGQSLPEMLYLIEEGAWSLGDLMVTVPHWILSFFFFFEDSK